MRKITALLATLITAYFLPTTVWAYCSIGTSDGNQSLTIPMRKVQVSPSAPVGTVLLNEDIPMDDVVFTCHSPKSLYTAKGAFTDKNDAVANAYNTGVPGVGIIFEITESDLLQGFLPIDRSHPVGVVARIKALSYSLVKTGDIESGVVTGMGHSLGVDARRIFNIYVDPQTIVASGCEVTRTSIPVKMPSAHRSHFTGIGYKTDPVAFSIPLNCHRNTRVKFKIDATADPSGLPGVMKLTSGTNIAKGVGIQISQNDVAVKFGVETAATGIGSGEKIDVPFTARYIQTLEEVEGGRANGRATFTMTYN